MEQITPTDAEPRRWQDVRVERQLTLSQLGGLLGRPHSTMLAYSCGKRRLPKKLLLRLALIFGEPVR